MFFDPLYILLMLPALVLTLGAQLGLTLIYGRYSGIASRKGVSGQQAAVSIAQKYGLVVDFSQSGGKLTDNYNPGNQVVTLSRRVALEPSIASVAIAAHEMGHVLQYQSGSLIMRFRSLLIPAVNFGSMLGYVLIMAGFLLAAAGLIWVGIIFFSLSTFFTLFTLPIEFDASFKGMRFIRELGLLEGREFGGARLVLIAAALTYVAAASASIANLLYYVLQARGMSRD